MNDPAEAEVPEDDAGAPAAPEPVAAAAPAPTPAPAPAPEAADDDAALIARLKERADALKLQIHKRVIGQDRVVDLLLIALFSRGHGLFVGVPGLAKTLLIQTLAEGLGLSFNRIQFTPDLMPSDITGTDVLEEDRASGRRSFRFLEGPLFANVLLADEINRTPPKTQAALLQAMQERKVTASGRTYPLEPPFLVFATQNPIEQEGTYPLPEAQLDRFMFHIDVGYPSEDEEIDIVRTTTGDQQVDLSPVLSREDVLAFQDLVRRVPVPEHVVRYAVQLARATRPGEGAPDKVAEQVAWGAGPRASQYLVIGAKARAALDGRFAASVDDVRDVAVPVLSHRVVVNFAAASAGVQPGTSSPSRRWRSGRAWWPKACSSAATAAVASARPRNSRNTSSTRPGTSSSTWTGRPTRAWIATSCAATRRRRTSTCTSSSTPPTPWPTPAALAAATPTRSSTTPPPSRRRWRTSRRGAATAWG
jgi:MoxR-like ATPase